MDDERCGGYREPLQLTGMPGLLGVFRSSNVRCATVPRGNPLKQAEMRQNMPESHRFQGECGLHVVLEPIEQLGQGSGQL